MALATYADLKAAMAGWNMDRSDLPAADLVTLSEARLARDLRVRTGEAETALLGAPGSRFISLPAGFLEPVALFVDVGGIGRRELRFIPAAMETSTVAGRPSSWSVDGSNLAFERPCDLAYSLTLRSVQALTSLSETAPTNWLLANAPDLYLAACNVEAALWLQDDQQAIRWQQRYADAVAAVNLQASRSKSRATLKVDAALTGASAGRRRFDVNIGD